MRRRHLGEEHSRPGEEQGEEEQERAGGAGAVWTGGRTSGLGTKRSAGVELRDSGLP